MRALFYHGSPEWSGSARAFAAAADGLVHRGWDVTFACVADSPVNDQVSRRTFEVVPMREGATWLDPVRRLKELMIERFIEVVFVHGDQEHFLVSMALRLAERAAILRRIPSDESDTGRLLGQLAARTAATGYLFDSKEELAAAASLPSKRISTLVAPLGVDLDGYDAVRATPRPSLGAAASDRLVVCVYDRLGHARSATVFRTFAMLAPRHPELRLALVGPGSDEEDLRMHAAALGLTKTVTYLGVRDDQIAVLRSADLGWVVASGDEAAFAMLDFMALRVPVIAERGEQAQRYLSDGIAGILLPAGDIPANAATLAAFLAHDEQRVAMGNAGRTRVARDFTATAMIDGFESAATVARERSAWHS